VDNELGAYLWQCEQAAATSRYVHARFLHFFKVLWAARIGDLTSDWRDRVTSDPHSAEDVLASHELATMPLRQWEPFVAAGEWRTAIDEWYSDLLALDAYRAAHERRPGTPIVPDEPPGARQLTRALQASPDFRRGLQAMDSAWARHRVIWGTLYRVGLAARGVDTDWRSWVESQATTLADTDDELAQYVGWARKFAQEDLPVYWTQPRPSTPPTPDPIENS
jgi:hypothetical protein